MQTLSRPGGGDNIQVSIFLFRSLWDFWNLTLKQNIQIFLTNASTTMWGSSKPEGVYVCLDLLQICSIMKKIIVVETFKNIGFILLC